jgi:hypothetical protein
LGNLNSRRWISLHDYIIAVFPSYRDAKKAIDAISSEGLSKEIMHLNKLPRFTAEEASSKLDGIISGVSDVFIGLPAFVNPMSAADLPPQKNTGEIIKNKWAKYGIDRDRALEYQKMMNDGKSVAAFKVEENYRSQLLEKLKQTGASETTIHSF